MYVPARLLFFQSTLLQEERQPDTNEVVNEWLLSIHAPTRGATTICFSTCVIPISLSIHAPTRGATRPDICRKFGIKSFNPRSYKRSDGIHLDKKSVRTRLSIHAPTRGATQFAGISFLNKYLSIHAPTRGATEPIISTFRCFVLSIHAPTRGATENHPQIIADSGFLSIHAPTRGATSIKVITSDCLSLSIHAPTRGATPRISLICRIIIAFNPRSYKRSDALQYDPGLILPAFNPRSYKRSDT